VPGSRLLLKAPSLKDDAVKARFAGLFEGQGIARERLEFRGPSGLADMMQEYGDIDIALDPTPYNGGTTTLQALWMGVPVITLNGGNFVSRMGASFLSTLHQQNWVAKDDADYVVKAAALAGNIVAQRINRNGLRQDMASSPLCAIEPYVNDLEDLYRKMWRVYCEGGRQRVLQ
jgi:predicted O-linked N-acetylglucosamine transferase (SPINDLY family)